jgi:acetyl esterase/lipase
MAKHEEKTKERSNQENKTEEKIKGRLLKAFKAVNSISGKSLTEADIKRQRAALERAGKLAAPTSDILARPFTLGDLQCQEFTPEFAHNPKYVVMYAHGGGYICGGLDYARILSAKLAIATGFTTYSFAYRLAPEHPYPEALDDAVSMWDYLTGSVTDADHILLAGDSAGGNLVLCLTQKLKEENRPLPKAILLFSPWTDMTGTAPSYDENCEVDPTLTKEYVVGAAKVYISSKGNPWDPRFSPLYGDFSSFPPTYIMAGRNEILLDDSIRLKEKIEEAGGNAVLDIEEDGWHVYQQLPIPLAKRAMKRLSSYVTSLIYDET